MSPREDRFTNYPEDAGRYDRIVFGDHDEDERPTRAEAARDEIELGERRD